MSKRDKARIAGEAELSPADKRQLEVALQQIDRVFEAARNIDGQDRDQPITPLRRP